MSENPSRRLNKVYVVLLLEYPEEGEGGYDSVEVVYITQDKTKVEEIRKLWDTVEKEKHHDDNKTMKALSDLQHKFGIICWSGEELRIEERVLQ
jgi:hypothetical protein